MPANPLFAQIQLPELSPQRQIIWKLSGEMSIEIVKHRIALLFVNRDQERQKLIMPKLFTQFV